METYLDWVLSAKVEFQPVCLALVYGVGVHDANIHEPGLEVLGLY